MWGNRENLLIMETGSSERKKGSHGKSEEKGKKKMDRDEKRIFKGRAWSEAIEVERERGLEHELKKLSPFSFSRNSIF